MTRFVVISEARSGSTMLGSALASHPQMLMHGEIFGSGPAPLNFYGIDEMLPWPTPLEIYLKKMRDADPVRFLDELVFADTARQAIGFKFKFEEFADWPAVVDYIVSKRLHVLFVRRRNLFDRYISEVEAWATGRFNSTDSTQNAPMAEAWLRDCLAPDAVCQAIEKGLALENMLYTTFFANPHIELVYEDIVGWEDAVSTKICNFLGVVPMALQAQTVKTRGEKRVSALGDLNALREQMRQRGYAQRC
ncbi:sulfotransferase [Acidocella sp. KAb 2-4]|uniref:sulfotransferase n=1 Tax=Acidocella sp. KAb 2-4 TaxID=2885158 RepID=UPI001D075E2E|nr:sulfotransferase [Acidocella sp. KAb 2-4]MCB5944213.1 sulfotransferase [Acidocella sp. KAb 2-4]